MYISHLLLFLQRGGDLADAHQTAGALQIGGHFCALQIAEEVFLLGALLRLLLCESSMEHNIIIMFHVWGSQLS